MRKKEKKKGSKKKESTQRQEGRKEGRKDGRTEGRKEGRTEGRKIGRKEGKKDGRKEERSESILRREGEQGPKSKQKLRIPLEPRTPVVLYPSEQVYNMLNGVGQIGICEGGAVIDLSVPGHDE